MALQFTLITSDKPARLTKHIRLDGETLRTEPGGQMIRGTYAIKCVETLRDFASVLTHLRHDEALIYGVPRGPQAGVILTRDALEEMPQDKRSGYVSRTNDCFNWPDGPGIFMLDIDPPTGEPAIERDQTIDVLRDLVPELRDVEMLWYPSSSSYIFTEAGRELQGLRGQRIYVPIQSASSIPDLADALWDRAWAAGLGRIQIASNGNILKRTFFDRMVYQPSRLDFAAGASTGAGLIQKRGIPEIV